ncbi:MAG: AEC family transporter [Geobacteraceae bacterium]|nr:AEC family transporter [Geobacteraceae bacterium]
MPVLERIIGIILPVFIIVATGYIYARLRGDAVKVDMTAVNRISMDVLCPMLVFSALVGKEFDLVHNGILILAGVAISFGSGILALPLCRLLGYDVRSFVPPMMYNNCGNMGLPLAALAFGTTGLVSAVAMFMAGSLVYFSVGIKIIETGRKGVHTSFFKLLISPMMIAMIAGILFSLVQIPLPGPLLQALKLLGEACIPIMLFALGVRMIDVSFRCWQIGLAGAVACPLTGLATAWILDKVLTMTTLQRGQMYLYAALPPAVFCFMVAEKYKQEPDKVAAIVLLGNLAALVFVPVGLWLGLRAI